ncbi:MAG: hypothetical protein HY736_27950, partial [Verrucomicrobia bacterium]|nr:hypothetical protein [Verrucomicrobiota bacterium]
GGIPGTNWALRPGGEGDRLRIDRPDLRDALAKSLRFVRGNAKLLAGGGGTVILVGDTGRYDENGHERARPVFEGLDERRVARVETDALRTKAGGADRMSVALPAGWQQLADAIERTAGARLSVRLRGTDTVTLSAGELEGNQLAVHLVNYATGETPKGLQLNLGNRWQTCRTARMLVPDAPESKLVIQRDPRPSVDVPPFAVYGVLIFAAS